MATLHTVNKSPFEKRALEQCLSRVSDGASLILIEDAVVAATANNEFSSLLTTAASKIELYVLTPDMEARGFGTTDLLPGINKVDYTGFVDLVTRHDRVHSWT